RARPRAPPGSLRDQSGGVLRHQSHTHQVHDEASRDHALQRASPAHGPRHSRARAPPRWGIAARAPHRGERFLRLLNFSVAGRRSFGALTQGGVVDLGVRLNAPVDDLTGFVRADLTAPARALAQGALADYRLNEVKILSPAGRTRYFCIGVNYPERNE